MTYEGESTSWKIVGLRKDGSYDLVNGDGIPGQIAETHGWVAVPPKGAS